MVEHSRKLTDFLGFYNQIKEMGQVWYCAQNFPSYLKSVRALPVKDLTTIDDEETREQYTAFCRKLGSWEMSKDMKNSRDIIKHFLSTKNNLFTDIELIMHITLTAALKLPTESVLESKVGKFERHFHKGRPMNESTMIDEFEVATNGPSRDILYHAP